MRKLLATCAIAVLGAGLQSAALAQAPMPEGTPATQGESASIQVGQVVYDSRGSKIGTIDGVTGPAGKQQVVVNVGKFLGMGSKNVLIPAEELSPKEGGGYATSLTAAEIGKFPEVQGNSD